ncbi:BES1-interacting Myc-like protein 2, putative isoform 2 [Hibiscus syriacus]|uniref:BES1-interacting Myc-like protein 2, putative isoform 2 n=1 Tax=Hibiscus syriacus TaxID=106335 RepID=A0A6A2X7B7_HIBSY|nr:BES1-interacting Myc-like protein 2, putative isoform 2 [Hibiscus syriacus]
MVEIEGEDDDSYEVKGGKEVSKRRTLIGLSILRLSSVEGVGLMKGRRVHSVFTGKVANVRGIVPRVEPGANKTDSMENFIDHSQTMKNGSSCENDGIMPSMVANMQNYSIESDLGDASVFKALDHPPASATSIVNTQTRSNTTATHGRGSLAFHESVSDSENMDDLTIRDEPEGLSNAYSQGFWLIVALQSSGDDMSQASIRVKIDAVKRVASGVTSMPSNSKEKEIQYVSNQVMAQTGVRSCSEEFDQAYKRHRTGKC